MKQRKNFVLLFSKFPEPGLVKTRLTTLKDGVFSPETASALYHCMLFDVVEICMSAFSHLEAGAGCSSIIREAKDATAGADAGSQTDYEDVYELVISTAPASSVDKMKALFENAGTWPRLITYICDEGESFDAHYNDAFEQVWDLGADCILSMGADMPALTVHDIIIGFDALHRLYDDHADGIVLAPDQEMGVSVIGWNRYTDFSHDGVFYNQEGLTVLPAYIDKARKLGLEAICLPPIPDVDTMADLMHNITLIEALNYCAPFQGNTPPWRCANALKEMGWDEVRVAPNDLRDPREHIDQTS